MEDESDISDNKTLENKSNLSLNFIYKKIAIKENIKNTKDNLRALNYEKIAKYKMRNMSINFLLNSIIKLKSSLQKSNPMMKYIKNVKPYDYSNIINNFNITNKTEILKKYFKFNNTKAYYISNNKTKNKNKKETSLDLSTKQKQYKNFYFSRMANIDHEKVINSRKEKIIYIQKHIRGFLRKKILDEEVNKIIIKKFIDKILIIQKRVREFLHKKKSLNNLIVNIIHNERKIKSNKITDLFSLYYYRNYYKKNLIIQKIIKERKEGVLLIQRKYRAYKYIQKVKEIILKEKDLYVLTYPYNALSVQIKIFYGINKAFKVFDFFKCPIRKYFVVYIDKNIFNSGEYLCQMIVDGNIKLDNRYKYIPYNGDGIYNLIYIGEKKQKVLKEKTKKKRKKKKVEEEENSDDFYYYCYNDNSNSTNSYTTKSLNSHSIIKEKEKEKSINSQKIKCNYILNELNHSVSSSKSYFSLNKINSYSKKTHKTKFGSNKRK